MTELKDIHILFNVLMNVNGLTFISKLYRHMELDTHERAFVYSKYRWLQKSDYIKCGCQVRFPFHDMPRSVN